MSSLSAPHLLAVGCSNMVSLCDIGSHGGCVGLLWAVDAQRGHCSLAVREAERLATEMLARPGVRSTCKIKAASTYCLLTSGWCIILYLCEADFSWFLLEEVIFVLVCVGYGGCNAVWICMQKTQHIHILYLYIGMLNCKVWLEATPVHFYHYYPLFLCPMIF